MNWLVLSFYLTLGTIGYQGQVFDSAGSAMFTMPTPSFQTTLGVEAQLFDNHLFFGGSVETWEASDGNGFFAPSEAFYVFSAGLRYSEFEIGYRHECDHAIISYWNGVPPSQGMLINKDEFYVNYTGHLKIF